QAGGSAPLSYQWRFYGTNLPGATRSSLTRSHVQAWYAGPYYLLGTNPVGWTTSLVATLSLGARPHLGSCHLTPSRVDFARIGDAGSIYAVERSSNLVNWGVLSTVSNATGQVFVTDPSNSNSLNRYYRARLLP